MIIVNSYKSQPFKMTIAVVTPVTFVLPIASGGSVYNGTIFWGDGTSSTVTAAGNYSKAYVSAGNYTIRIIGLFHGIYFNNTGTSKDLVTSISGMERLKALANSFNGCRLTSVGGTIRPGIANLYAAWQGNRLTSWNIPIPSSVTNISAAWMANQLTSWNIPIPSSVTAIGYAWYGNQLTSWNTPIPSSVINASNTWAWNTNLTTFGANLFNNCPCTSFNNSFQSTALTQSSIDNILVSINSNNTSNGTFNQSGGSAPSATGQAAITAMRSRGWTITVTGGF